MVVAGADGTYGSDPETVSPGSPAGAEEIDGWGRSRVATFAAWALFAIVALIVARSVLAYDFRSRPIIGDQASFLMNAESLAHEGHNLSYDRADLERFRAAGWADQPYGLFFQRYRYGWSFAKPYGYSVWLAGPIRILGPERGVQLANLALLGAITALGASILRLRFRGAAVPLTLGAFLFGSNLFFYTYHLYTELFLVVLVAASLLALVKGAQGSDARWVGVGLGLSAFLVAEKAPALLVVGPAAAVGLVRLGTWRRRLPVLGVSAAVFAVAIVPYVFYSGGRTWNAYGGERYYAVSGVPFDGLDAGFVRWRTDETFSVGYVRENLFHDVPGKLESAAYYAVGRHTGIVGFMPLAAVLLVASLAVGRRGGGLGWAVLGGLLAYVAFYVALFPRNYYGGGQSFGDRYFLQASTAVLFLPVLFKLRARTLGLAALLSAAFAVAYLWPHYHDATGAVRHLDRTSAVQWAFPFEANQENASYFRPPAP